MANLFIAVGGTGQHGALAVARLVHLRALPADIRCVLLDADQTGPLPEKVKTFDGYATERYGTRHPLDGAERIWVPYDASLAARAKSAEGGTVPFRSIFAGRTRGNGAQPTLAESTFGALFLPDDANRDILKGFYARPTLGATCFAAQGQDVVNEILAKASKANMVMISGSFIGGTGAGVIPSLVQHVVQNDKWFGTFLLNWLDPPGGTGSDAITENVMHRNMVHGLQYFYRWIAPKLKASVLMGPPKADAGIAAAAKPVADGSEIPSIYPVLVGRALLHFLTNTTAPYKGSVLAYTMDTGTAGDGSAQQGHASDAAESQRLLGEPWYGGKTLRARIFAAQRADFWLGYYCKSDKNRKKLADAFGLFGGKGGVPSGLYLSIERYAKQAGIKPKALVDPLIENLDHRRKTLARCVAYFEQVFHSLGRDDYFHHVGAREPDDDCVLGELKRIWDKPYEAPADRGPSAEWYAQRLANGLVDELLADLWPKD